MRGRRLQSAKKFKRFFEWTNTVAILTGPPNPGKMVTAVLPHPGHGRLVEKVMMVVSSIICYKECFYTLSWWSGDVAYYQPAYAETVSEGCCGVH